MKFGRFKWTTAILIALMLANLAIGVLILRRLDAPAPTPVATTVATQQHGRQRAVVARAIDGDTIELESGERVRYLGVDTPESKANQNLSSPEFYGPEASDYNRELVEGQTVVLEADTTETDDYGRLLRWVFLEDGTFVQAELVRNGYAFVNIIPPDDTYAGILRDLERTARAENRGVWEEFKPIAGGSGADEAPAPGANNALSDSDTKLVATFTPASSDVSEESTTVEPAPASCDPSLVDGAIGPDQTQDVLDEQATVVFAVVRTFNSGEAVFLNSHEPYEGYFYVIAFPSVWDRFPEAPETYFDGRCVAIAGRVQAYDGTPQVVLRDPGQVEILR